MLPSRPRPNQSPGATGQLLRDQGDDVLDVAIAQRRLGHVVGDDLDHADGHQHALVAHHDAANVPGRRTRARLLDELTHGDPVLADGGDLERLAPAHLPVRVFGPLPYAGPHPALEGVVGLRDLGRIA